MGEEGLLLQESTIAVRHFYTAQGFIPKKFPHVADDHIALELDFMKRLATACAERDDAADEVSRAFLDEHLGVWAPRFAENVRQAGCAYYAAASDLLVGLVAVDRDRLSGVAG